MIDEQADRSSSPANARDLACKLRLRAAAIEAGSETEERAEEATRMLRELGDMLDEE